ncbi:MAG: methyltransferase [Alphaproteobacteria bacterium]|jgi:methyltransferase|nr:methyltransferase [Alphaproteobacteria bacterium]
MGDGAFLIAFIVVQRLAELLLARRNTARLLVGGGIETGRSHYPWMVALHAAWLLALWLYGRDHPVDPILLLVFLLLQAGRIWVIASLGRRWTTRVIVMPGECLVSRGPYRWLRHPNYVIVALEIAVVPLALGLPVLALIFTVLNAAVLYRRIRVENAALARAEDGRANGQTLANET